MLDASLTRQDAKVGVIREKEETHEGIRRVQFRRDQLLTWVAGNKG
jgi:hypothetical protein